MTTSYCFHEEMCTLKGTSVIGFRGDFMANFMIPDFMGLGKSVSRGFGTIERLK
ncbi:MAG: CRISPR-associated endonuclease Cas6 [Methanotrichaceae archaeon]